ncbi:uncharacterized protein [Miscanthus floridulus]|uniref:uncharacterized protein isoform X3 n=1 Tax=Miscanthus floridulus TaxID=154761 RepID=UPI00345979DE
MLLMSLRAADPYEQETCRMFMEWKAKYRQTYRYAGEEECRYAVFKESRRRVARARAAGVTSGLNGRSATAIEEIYRGHRVRMGERSFEQETRRMFVGWKAKYGKTYRDVGEEECRYRLFKGNHRRVVVRLNRRRRAKPVRPQPIRRPHQRGGPLTLLPGDGGPRAERQVPSRRPRPGPRPWEADPLPEGCCTKLDCLRTGAAKEEMTACMILPNQLENLCQSGCTHNMAIHKGSRSLRRRKIEVE